MRLGKICSPFLLGLASVLSPQNLSAQNPQLPKVVESVPIQDNLKKILESIDKDIKDKTNWNRKLEPIFEQVEKLKPEDPNRKALLLSLKKIAILQASLPDRATIAQRLIEIMSKNREKNNWSEITQVVIDIMHGQAVINGKWKGYSYVNPEIDDEEVLSIEYDEQILKPLSTLFQSTFNKPITKGDSSNLKELQFEAAKWAIVLAKAPFGQAELLNIWNSTKFKELASLPETRASELVSGLAELSKFYKENVVDWELLRNLMTGSKGEVIQIFQTSLKLLSSDDSQKQKTGADVLSKLKEFFSSEGIHYFRSILEAKKHSSLFFSETMQKPASDPIATEALVRSGLIILKLAQDRESFPLNFVQGLSVQINHALDSNQKNKKDGIEKQKILEAGVSSLLNDFYNCAPGMTPENRTKVLHILVPTYKRLIEKNASEPKYLSSALDIFLSFKNIVPTHIELNKDIKETIQRDLFSLLEITLESISNLPDSENKQLLKKKAFTLPKSYTSDTINNQNSLIEFLSKKLLNKQKVNTEDLFYFCNSVFPTNPHTGGKYLAWTSYIALKFVSDNTDYFTACVEQAIKDAEKLEGQEEKMEARNNLVEINTFFQELPHLGQITYQQDNEHKELHSKIKTWAENCIEKPIIKSFLSFLGKESVTVKMARSRYERYIENKSWRELNKLLKGMISNRPALRKDLVDIVKKRLQDDKDPYLREMDFETLFVAAPSSIIVPLLRQGIVNEESPEAIRGIGKTLAFGLMNGGKLEYEYFPDYVSFLQILQSEIIGKEPIKKDLSELQGFLIDIVRIINGDSNLCMKFLPNCSFKPGKDGKLDPKERDALMQLRRNAFLTLAYFASQLPFFHTPYGETITPFLERRLEKYGDLEKLGGVWGDEIASLIEIYRAMETTIDEEMGKKIKFLRETIFDGHKENHLVEGEQRSYEISPLFTKLEKAMFTRLKQNKGIFKDNLEPNEERTLRESDEYEEIKRKINRSKYQLAERMLEHAPDKSMEFYKNCLKGMGYGDSQLRDILRTVFKSDN